jgi:hypothetical protein
MKTKKTVVRWLGLVGSVLVCCGLNLDAQTAPTITAQPVSQTNLAGSNVTFTVAVDGTGPFTYQWQFNGTNLATNIITTVAGNGSASFSGDGGWATNASLADPYGVAFDAVGNLYISDAGHQRIRKVDTSGIITTVAGNGGANFSGDGGAAIKAGLNSPWGVALDGVGNLYFADEVNQRIRKVGTNGIITTVAGNGYEGFYGDGGAATSAELYFPQGVALDGSGNLYIGDISNGRVRKVDTNDIITTVAGNGSFGYSGDGGPATNAMLSQPSGVAVDAAGNLYIADAYNNHIRKVDTNGIITTVAGNGNETYSGDGGAATNASLANPYDLVLDGSGNMYIADTYNNRIRKVDTNGIITTVAGNGWETYAGDGGAATNANLGNPFGVAVDASGNIFIADTGNNRIRKVHPGGYPTLPLNAVRTNNSGNYTVVVTSPYGSVTSAVATLTVVQPPSIVGQSVSPAVLPGSNATLSVMATGTPPLFYSWYFNATNLVQDGTIPSFIVSNMNSGSAGQYSVVVTNAYGSETSLFATLALAIPPSVTTQSASQTNLAGSNVTFNVTVDGTGPFFFQWQFNGTNLPNNIITTVAGNGSLPYSGDGGAATNAGLYNPSDVAIDALANLYIADTSHNLIRKVDANGIITTVAGNGNEDYSGDGVPATNTSLYGPLSVALDTLGNLYIADSANERIRKVDTSGIITTLAGNEDNGYFGNYSGDGGPAANATLNTPSGVALDAFGGLYIADAGNNRIRKIDTSGTITTVAGNGLAGFYGDSGAATNASLYDPVGVIFDGTGNLYIADQGNGRIRKVDTNGIITTMAGGGSGGLGGAATNANLQAPYATVFTPLGMALDVFGNLYISDGNLQRILKVDTNGIISSIAGNGTGDGYSGDGGAATNAGLNEPSGVALDGIGNLYVADTGDERIREVHFAGFPTLLLTNVSTNNTGNYAVVITTPYGSATSTVAALTVVLPPSIVVQPASQEILPGSNAILSVTAAGTPPFYYSWYLNTTNLVQNSTNASLILTNASSTNTGQYTVVVTNAYGSVTSQVAIVAFPPSLTAQPTSQTVLPGTNVAFDITVGGVGPFTYQWQFNGTNLPNGVITTVAGTGTNGYYGDGGAAINASFKNPRSVTFDSTGELYIADYNNNRVRRMNASGIVTTVAGTGTNGFSGDGGAATNASIGPPYGLALDSAGNFYIADNNNNRVRKVDTSGIITTVAGGGSGGDGGAATNADLYGPTGVCLDAAGNLYIATSEYSTIRKVDTNGIITTVAGNGNFGFSGDGGAATNATLDAPFGVALDATDNLYIADYSNNRIRKVDTNGIITTVAGDGPSYPNNGTYSGDGGQATNAGLNHPVAMTLDAVSNLYIADSSDNRIRIVTPSGIISTVAGNGQSTYAGDGGAATNARLYSPSGLAFDTAGNLYIGDYGNNRIRKVLLYAVYPTLALLNVGATNAGNYAVVITSPYGSVTSAVATLTVQAPPIITAQPASQSVGVGSNALISVTAAGSELGYSWYLAGTNLLQNGTNSTLLLPGLSSNNGGSYSVVVTNPYGSVTSQVATLTIAFPPYVSEQLAGQTILAGSNATFTIAAGGTGPIHYQWQFDGTSIPNYSIITTVAGNGTAGFSGDGGPATNAELSGPNSATVDAYGNIYIADWGNNRIRKVAANGIISTLAGTGGSGSMGNGVAATNDPVGDPMWAVADGAGNVFISMTGWPCIAKVGTNGIMTRVAGTVGSGFAGDGGPATNANLNWPSGICLDTAGNLYIADTDNNRIRKVGTNGIITTVAGTNGYGFSGDGGAAINAKLYQPYGVYVDSIGNILISDTMNNRIRKVNTNGIISTVAGKGPSGMYVGSYSGDGGMATNAGLSNPDAMTFDLYGNLLIADAFNDRIRSVSPSGIITTIAGGGTNGLGDGGPPTSAQLVNVSSAAVDANGNIFVDDNFHCRIREVSQTSPSLLITNATSSNAGSYSVIITGPYGSITSAVATLTVAASRPQIVTGDGFFGFVNNQFGFNVSAAAGEVVVVDGSIDLVNWTPICTNTVSGSLFYFCDACRTNSPWRFYRARLP